MRYEALEGVLIVRVIDKRLSLHSDLDWIGCVLNLHEFIQYSTKTNITITRDTDTPPPLLFLSFLLECTKS